MHLPRQSKLIQVRGFTLFEVMMATSVVMVAVVGLIQAVTIGSEMLDVSRKQTTAMLLIRNEIDNIHLKDWTTVNGLVAASPYTLYVNSAGNGVTSSTTDPSKRAFALTSYSPATTDDNTALMALAKDFTIALSMTTVKTNLIQLTYTVSWTGGNIQKVYTRTGTTYYGRYGLNLYYRR